MRSPDLLDEVTDSKHNLSGSQPAYCLSTMLVLVGMWYHREHRRLMDTRPVNLPFIQSGYCTEGRISAGAAPCWRVYLCVAHHTGTHTHGAIGHTAVHGRG
eukprot:COSAG02_NODE_538_length_20609_cov_7.009703_30_plen_101_part_00